MNPNDQSSRTSTTVDPHNNHENSSSSSLRIPSTTVNSITILKDQFSNTTPKTENIDSWVKFDEDSNSGSGPSSTSITINGHHHNDNEGEIKSSSAINSSDLNDHPLGIRMDPINKSTTTSLPPVIDQQPQFATIDLSNDDSCVQIKKSPEQINNNKNNNNIESPSSVNNSNVTASNVNPNSSRAKSSSPPCLGFQNGDIIVTLTPLNDNCAWISPAKFKAHLVPEELMAQSLTLTVEDYVTTMSILLNDYRFHLYITLHKRILSIWFSFSIIILLGILASGTKGLSIFLAGILWIILNAMGIFLIIYVKHKLYHNLEDCMAQVNNIFGKHNIFLGVDDRGHFSCHKINLIFVYFDPKYCLKFLQDMLKNSNNLNNSAAANNQTTSIVNDLYNGSEMPNDIYITGSSGTKQISLKEKQAERLLYRYSQRWIREYGRQRMSLSVIQPQPVQSPEPSTSTSTTIVIDKNPITVPSSNISSSNPNPTTTTDIPPRHCRVAKCFCQYIEELYKFKQLRKQQQQQQLSAIRSPMSWMRYCFRQ